MGNAENSQSGSKPRVKVSIFHLLLVLLGSNLMLLLTPNVGMLNGFLYIPDLYTWSATLIGIALLGMGLNGLYKKI